ncbi:hypothetical protein BFP72_10240 [Reichenbachiella sp. 5M10]|uniref:hypothetical protein n=1 Tax=Reichenbachiella sp. 5M10 TaxID=1889772 RepID=UPI000C1570B4|nr:hypothetical protein [Reichenbachiella sp. 5M10]PIB35744.1 hypothetical protein BFP72_10240 [Reichenbachiella sp. 5M10]
MEIETIAGLTGKASYSPNGNFVVVRQFPPSELELGKVVLANSARTEPIYIRSIKYPDHIKVANSGVVILCNVEHENPEFFNQLLILDLTGKKMFDKKSNCPICATAINHDGTIGAVAFAGAEEYVESYQIFVIDIPNSKIAQTNQIPDRTGIAEMYFDESNSLKVQGVS